MLFRSSGACASKRTLSKTLASVFVGAYEKTDYFDKVAEMVVLGQALSRLAGEARFMREVGDVL